MHFEPATLPCGHSFCFGCLGEALRGSAKCPNCRSPAPAAHTLKVNAALVQTMETNGGPGFLKLAPTLRLHAALRAGDTAGARAAMGAAGCDLARRVRSGAAGSPTELPLHFVLGEMEKGGLAEDKMAQWVEMAKDLARKGVGLCEKSAGGVLPLDRSHNFTLTKVMLESGATVCTAVAFSNVAGWGYATGWGKREYIDGVLLKVLSRVGAFDPTNEHVISGLCNSIRFGHELTAIWLLEKGVKVPSKVHPLLLNTPPLCVARPIKPQ
jgi:hypothetical protein